MASRSEPRKGRAEKRKTTDPAYDLEHSTSFSAKEILLKRGTPARLSEISRACTRTPTNPRAANQREHQHEQRDRMKQVKYVQGRRTEKVEGYSTLATDLFLRRFSHCQLQTDEKDSLTSLLRGN